MLFDMFFKVVFMMPTVIGAVRSFQDFRTRSARLLSFAECINRLFCRAALKGGVVVGGCLKIGPDGRSNAQTLKGLGLNCRIQRTSQFAKCTSVVRASVDLVCRINIVVDRSCARSVEKDTFATQAMLQVRTNSISNPISSRSDHWGRR